MRIAMIGTAMSADFRGYLSPASKRMRADRVFATGQIPDPRAGLNLLVASNATALRSLDPRDSLRSERHRDAADS